jgi:hypothetical protein
MRAGGRTDKQDEAVAFRNFANAAQKRTAIRSFKIKYTDDTASSLKIHYKDPW